MHSTTLHGIAYLLTGCLCGVGLLRQGNIIRDVCKHSEDSKGHTSVCWTTLVSDPVTLYTLVRLCLQVSDGDGQQLVGALHLHMPHRYCSAC